MSAIEVKILLEQATRAPVEKLSAGDLSRLRTVLRQSLGRLEGIVEKEEMLKLEATIPPEDMELYQALKRREKKDAPSPALAIRRAAEQCSAISDRLRPVLSEIRKAGPEESATAAATMDDLSKEDREWLSLLANVSDANGKLIRYSSRTRSSWLAGVGLKISGFERTRKRKAR